ncbi:hypothetical protein [Blastococcus sp. TF02A-26]|uniref:Rv0361 family membrane protein n=1 Tax=Blastococcus sp. TF02A-26 TaxID=2250577 RepID=UPI000DEB0416|nr:hypothetical protein [Blastococcus sp. TF02A-26]RBY83120.1 hypothetical protein DQ240_17050 [Blastococcus sp. TF02A-26]
MSQPPQPHVPAPQQAQLPHGGPLAVGFPNYRSPAPSPPRRTGLVVGTVVVLVTVVFAVVGFLIVGGRGANSPEGAVEGLFSSLADGDSSRAHDLLCDELRAQISEDQLMTPSGPLAGMQEVSIEVGDATDLLVPGQEAAAVPYRVTDSLGNEAAGTATVVEDKGWRVCGFG